MLASPGGVRVVIKNYETRPTLHIRVVLFLGAYAPSVSAHRERPGPSLAWPGSDPTKPKAGFPDVDAIFDILERPSSKQLLDAQVRIHLGFRV